jgi:hypothetical protein
MLPQQAFFSLQKPTSQQSILFFVIIILENHIIINAHKLSIQHLLYFISITEPFKFERKTHSSFLIQP